MKAPLSALVFLLLPFAALACTDFVFLVDGSSASFESSVDLAVGLISNLDISSRGQHLSVVEYGAKPSKTLKWPQFLFKHIKSTPQSISVLRRLPVLDGPSDAGHVLEILNNEILPQRQSPDVPVVVIHLSDGLFNKSDYSRISELATSASREPNVYLYPIATSKEFDVKSLTALAAGNRNRVIAAGDVHSKALNTLRQFFKCDLAKHEENLRRKPKLSGIQDAATTKTTQAPVTKKDDGKRATESLKENGNEKNGEKNKQGPKDVESQKEKQGQRQNLKEKKTELVKKSTLPKDSLKNRFYFSSTSTTTTKKTTTTTTTTPKPFTGKPGCQSDVVILLDLSGGARDKHDNYLQFSSDLVKAFKIGPFDTQVAIVRYSGPGRTESQFHLNKHAERSSMTDEIASIQPMGGTTRTGEALLFAAEEFSEKLGARPKSERSIVVFTDGYSQDDPSDAARTVQRKGIHVYAVAVENDEVPPNTEQLLTIASDKQSFFFSKEFSHLKDKLVRRNC
ncbi:hypothetical protein L596_028059 [Steinernema carpocapsae]|uniref:VWFA domain-containing protein n=1 Tax=Steinernema carpocapsae TaxID=34508 RepID=A0A4U5LXD3_STECR|nr:hypothetical protein L596_028059 [Steinernema carpocapsae]